MKDQLDYLENAHNFDSKDFTEEEVEQWGNLLFQISSTLDDKKKALGILAHIGTLVAYKQLKKYAEQPDKDLETWAKLALGECTMFLHSDLMGDDEQDFVYTGVGINNDLLRVYFMLLPLEGKSFEAWQYKIIENETIYVSKDLKCEIEWFEFKTDRVSFSLLMPTDIVIATIIERCIDNCNQFGGFLLEEYYCATGVPEEKEVKEIIHIVRNGIKDEETFYGN